jgi:hypothetical protein
MKQLFLSSDLNEDIKVVVIILSTIDIRKLGKLRLGGRG